MTGDGTQNEKTPLNDWGVGIAPYKIIERRFFNFDQGWRPGMRILDARPRRMKNRRGWFTGARRGPKLSLQTPRRGVQKVGGGWALGRGAWELGREAPSIGGVGWGSPPTGANH